MEKWPGGEAHRRQAVAGLVEGEQQTGVPGVADQDPFGGPPADQAPDGRLTLQQVGVLRAPMIPSGVGRGKRRLMLAHRQSPAGGHVAMSSPQPSNQ